ncbi:MAG: hypothetical protein KA190_29165 [Kofleriaceae bacterium]|jgi:hypothetical protein|nr:hypothetical protein [Kofleriaceae bacterium]
MRMRSLSCSLGLVLASACGGGPPVYQPPPTDPDVARDVSMLCAAPTRASADPAFGSSAPDEVIDRHLTDGLRSAKVKATVAGWVGGKGTTERLRELDALIHEVDFTSKCRLVAVWSGEETFEAPEIPEGEAPPQATP